MDKHDTSKILDIGKVENTVSKNYAMVGCHLILLFCKKENFMKKYGKFDLGFGIAADYDFMLRMLGKYKISTSYLPKSFI